MKIKNLFILTLALLFATLPLSVGAISSTTYEIDQGINTQSVHHLIKGSATYEIEGSLDPIAGNLEGASRYEIQSGDAFGAYCGDNFIDSGETCDGSALNGQTCASQGYDGGTLACTSACAYSVSGCTSGGGGGGGGGGGTARVAPNPPTVDEEVEETTFSYGSSFVLYGDRPDGTTVLVDGSSTGVTYPTTTTWQVTLSLAYGSQSYAVTTESVYGESSETIFSLYRRLIGDLTEDDTVNDYDLSIFVHLWSSDDTEGDFNQDGDVDDYDFSMMVSRWGMSV
ncbi:TPA: hypothetical protein DDZ01_01765 [Candidatus Uhrbacteria bacterium]|nr:MAG: Clostripain-related protein [Candidatus Uhrbacteria bacterium GW2011_GWF2_40_263]OGL96683.1 MAG: hypothetical protein A2332_05175 [Candidatus Uhrbacteria bacterium RIFOXYB2_FULL_41_18]HBK34702.1 hypothetical protein [Candidatus Uhrbacteria bacterium]HCB55996.1 hypothetical protein [Candidatus Uhrbacteria bacterium]